MAITAVKYILLGETVIKTHQNELAAYKSSRMLPDVTFFDLIAK